MAFNNGTEVEVTSNDDGFRGIWYVAKITQPPKKSDDDNESYVVVEYNDLVSEEDESKKLCERVHVSLVRPLPTPMVNDDVIQVNDVVDVYHKDGWWVGVVEEFVDTDELLVCFDDPPDEMLVNKLDVRLHLDWVLGTWQKPKKKNLNKDSSRLAMPFDHPQNSKKQNRSAIKEQAGKSCASTVKKDTGKNDEIVEKECNAEVDMSVRERNGVSTKNCEIPPKKDQKNKIMDQEMHNVSDSSRPGMLSKQSGYSRRQKILSEKQQAGRSCVYTEKMATGMLGGKFNMSVKEVKGVPAKICETPLKKDEKSRSLDREMHTVDDSSRPAMLSKQSGYSRRQKILSEKQQAGRSCVYTEKMATGMHGGKFNMSVKEVKGVPAKICETPLKKDEKSRSLDREMHTVDDSSRPAMLSKQSGYSRRQKMLSEKQQAGRSCVYTEKMATGMHGGKFNMSVKEVKGVPAKICETPLKKDEKSRSLDREMHTVDDSGRPGMLSKQSGYSRRQKILSEKQQAGRSCVYTEKMATGMHGGKFNMSVKEVKGVPAKICETPLKKDEKSRSLDREMHTVDDSSRPAMLSNQSGYSRRQKTRSVNPLAGKSCVSTEKKATGMHGGIVDKECNAAKVDISVKEVKVSEELEFCSSNGVNFMLEKNLSKCLKDYQIEGVKWLFNLNVRNCGGILADEMGLGKTKQVCAFLKGLFNTSSIEKVLIIAPATLLFMWMEELEKMGLEPYAKIYPRNAKPTRRFVQGNLILLASYSRLNKDELYTGLFDGIRWDHVVLDEGHGVKSSNAIRFQNARKLHVRPGAFIILSGTVVQNNLKELWALMDLCNPNLLGTLKSFRHNFDLTIKLGNRRTVEEIPDHYAKEAVKKLQKLVEPFYLRREKRMVLQLPDKDELVIWLRPTKIQRMVYMDFLKFYKEKISHRAHKETLPSLRMLEAICSHPNFLMEAISDKKSKATDFKRLLKTFECKEITPAHSIQCSTKCIFLSEMLPKIVGENRSVLIFSSSCMMLDLVQQIVKNTLKYMCVRIDGKTNLEEREKAVHEFQSGNVRILLLSIKVGSMGLTLTAATRVILLDPSWNPSFDSQAVDRAHRIGQSNEVIVYRLITTGTIEERIYRNQVYKTTLSRSLHGKEEPLKIFNPKDDPKAFVAEESSFDRSVTKGEIDKLLSNDLHEMKLWLRDHVRVLEDNDYIAGVTYHTDVISRVNKGTRRPASYGMPQKGPQVQPRAAQPAIMLDQAPTAAAYSQQGVQHVSGYGQPGVQQASRYAQAGATGAYDGAPAGTLHVLRK